MVGDAVAQIASRYDELGVGNGTGGRSADRSGERSHEVPHATLQDVGSCTCAPGPEAIPLALRTAQDDWNEA